MIFANDINNLVVKFNRLDVQTELNVKVLVMERLYPTDCCACEVEIRELWLDVFENEIEQLHTSGFVHRHLKRPSYIGGQTFVNILLTNFGLRLIDAGFSALKSQVGNFVFEKYVGLEQSEMKMFRDYFLNR